MDIALIYMHQKVWPGGMATFTAHLYEALRLAGHTPMIFHRSSDRMDGQIQKFGDYGFDLRRTSERQLLTVAKAYPSLMVNTTDIKNLKNPNLHTDLQKAGALVVLHDVTQFDHLGGSVEQLKVPTFVRKPITIRQRMADIARGIYIPHPYVLRNSLHGLPSRTRHAVSTARVASAKRPRIILQANRLLPKSKRVVLLGAESRITGFSLSKSYKDVYTFDGSAKRYPQNFDAPLRVCARYRFHVDMSFFPLDGGGTQYAQLEAIEAGCVPIMHRDWFRHDLPRATFRAGRHVLTVGDPEELAALLGTADYDRYTEFQERGLTMLREVHNPRKVAARYLKELRK